MIYRSGILGKPFLLKRSLKRESRYERILYRYLQPSYATSTITPDQVTELVSDTAHEISRDAKETIQKISGRQRTVSECFPAGTLCLFV